MTSMALIERKGQPPYSLLPLTPYFQEKINGGKKEDYRQKERDEANTGRLAGPVAGRG